MLVFRVVKNIYFVEIFVLGLCSMTQINEVLRCLEKWHKNEMSKFKDKFLSAWDGSGDSRN
jgi:hypothetical protein